MYLLSHDILLENGGFYQFLILFLHFHQNQHLSVHVLEFLLHKILESFKLFIVILVWSDA